jgi:hypothetical protein
MKLELARHVDGSQAMSLGTLSPDSISSCCVGGLLMSLPEVVDIVP